MGRDSDEEFEEAAERASNLGGRAPAAEMAAAGATARSTQEEWRRDRLRHPAASTPSPASSPSSGAGHGQTRSPRACLLPPAAGVAPAAEEVVMQPAVDLVPEDTVVELEQQELL